jgi:hypothetical protein
LSVSEDKTTEQQYFIVGFDFSRRDATDGFSGHLKANLAHDYYRYLEDVCNKAEGKY